MAKKAKIKYSINIELESIGTLVDRGAPSTIEGFVAGIMKNAAADFYKAAKKELTYLNDDASSISKEVRVIVDVVEEK